MSRNSAEYNDVLAVKKALISIPQLKREIEVAQASVRKTNSSIAEEERREKNPIPTPYHANSVIAQFKKPYLDEENRIAAKKTRRLNRRIRFFCVLGLLLMLTVGVVAAGLGIEYSWGLNEVYSVEQHIAGCEKYDDPEGMAIRYGGCASLIAFNILLLLANFLAPLAGKHTKGVGVAFRVICLSLGACLTVYCITLTQPFWENFFVDGFMHIALFFNSFRHLHLALLAAVFFVAFLLLLLAPLGRLIRSHQRPDRVLPRVLKFDLAPLYATDVYRRACELDRAEAPAQKARIVELAKKNLGALRPLLQKQQAGLSSLQNSLSFHQRVVNNSVLHPSYRNLEMVSIILHYFELNRAETIVQAVNEYTHDKQYEKWIETQKRIAQEMQEAINRQTAEYAAMRRAQEDAAASYAAEQEKNRQAIAAENRRSIEAADARARSVQSEIYNSGVRLENAIRYS